MTAETQTEHIVLLEWCTDPPTNAYADIFDNPAVRFFAPTGEVW